MNQRLHIAILLMLGMMTLLPGICFARNRALDSTVVNRVWDFYATYSQHVQSTEDNVYMVYSFGSKRRNALLFLVPTMYSIAKGDKQYIGESYCKLKFRNNKEYEINRQVVCGTIPHNRNVMPALNELMTPNLYGVQLYQDRLLSPFHRSNRFFYKYRVTYSGSHAYLSFRPRSSNTQLVKGKAYIDVKTGRVISVIFNGEFDMISFKINANMDRKDSLYVLPARCTTDAEFKFLGNHIQTNFSSYYECPTTLPDSINEKNDLQLMVTLRPRRLNEEQQSTYERYNRETAHQRNDTLPQKYGALKKLAWDVIGDNMVNSLNANSENISLHVSPLFNPLYMSYSPSKGISYKLNIGLRYAWNTHRYLTLDPHLGYSFKIKQFYYHLPLRMTYNPKRNGYTEISWGNGNRISNAALNDIFQQVRNDSLTHMPDFKDEYLQVVNNVVAYDWLEIMAGLVYHRRQSINCQMMQEAGLTDEYRSFAPMLTVRLTPWKKGPTLTANYERSLSNVLHSNLAYERWEFDAAYKHQAKSVRILNMRMGTGFYTHRSSEYFVDYTNFRDNNLPTGWEDDWSGQFQLADPRWYNQSDYYLRGHVSYDSPLLCLSWLPSVGRLVETERIYLSAMSIGHTRPYYEIGYGFKNRFFSTGLFASFFNNRFEKFGCKFTIELFRRW